jgi:flagellar biosynthetic protein FliO
MGAALLSTTIALGIVCALAVALLRLIGRRPRARGMRVVAQLPLDGRRSLYVVEAAGRCLLLGAGDGPVTLLTELDGQRLHAELAERPPRASLAQDLLPRDSLAQDPHPRDSVAPEPRPRDSVAPEPRPCDSLAQDPHPPAPRMRDLLTALVRRKLAPPTEQPE